MSLDENEAASGSLFYDDGESLDTVQKGEYFLGDITMSQGEIKMSVIKDGYRGLDSLAVERIIVLGLGREVEGVTINGLPHTQWSYEASGLIISGLTGLGVHPNDNFTILLI